MGRGPRDLRKRRFVRDRESLTDLSRPPGRFRGERAGIRRGNGGTQGKFQENIPNG